MKDLIIFRSGRRSLHPLWSSEQSEGVFDIYVCPYQELAPAETPRGTTVGEVIPGQKWTGLRQLLKSWQGWRDYRYIMLADDDLLMTPAAATAFFRLCAAMRTKLAQPALSLDSYSSHLITVQNLAFMTRQTTFVEVMAPCFHADALKDLLWTLDLTETGLGWGLDYLWPKLLDFKDIHIMDRSPLLHALPVGRGRNPDLHTRSNAELAAIIKRFGCPRWRRTLSGVTARGVSIAPGDPMLLLELVRGYDAVFGRKPTLLEEFLKSQMAA